MKTLHIANSYLTNTIFAGHVLKSGMWAASRQNVTDQPVVLPEKYRPLYRITVERLGA